MPHHGGDFRFVHQPVGHRYRLFRFARVIPLHQHNLFAFDTAGGIDISHRLRGPLPVLGAVGSVGAGEGPGDADLHVSLGVKGHAHTTCYHNMKRHCFQFQRHSDIPQRFRAWRHGMTQKISLTVWYRRRRSARTARVEEAKIPPGREVAPESGRPGQCARDGNPCRIRQGRIPFQVRRSVAITWRAGQRGIRTGP